MKLLGKNTRLTEEEKNLDLDEILDRINFIENLKSSVGLSRKERYKLTIKKKLLEKLYTLKNRNL
ncbi:hypothetical protein J7K25_03180 [bacterium]|nr:hypothetical protein [bacterium]